MRIEKITSNKKQYLDLLLSADEQEDMMWHSTIHFGEIENRINNRGKHLEYFSDKVDPMEIAQSSIDDNCSPYESDAEKEKEKRSSPKEESRQQTTAVGKVCLINGPCDGRPRVMHPAGRQSLNLRLRRRGSPPAQWRASFGFLRNNPITLSMMPFCTSNNSSSSATSSAEDERL